MHIQDIPCEMEVDLGSVLLIISKGTFHHVCAVKGNWCFKPLPVQLTDCQGWCVPVAGMGTFQVDYQNFSGPLQLVVVEGHCTNQLGLDWFEPLGITMLGIHQADQLNAEAIYQEFPNVFDDSLGLYNNPPI